nr:hypothetical protein Iba_chr01aCG18500 [Ipomoea batatas]GMC50600.1 hypothetical protein Iba_chr01bCG18410 [Ipomoea batatas]GMC71607.1 hypothetical protein Iba_chr03bCG4110 [Ipomoea batatas]GMD22838.1 hypothetical protein Iba_scaffold42190CG0010 [Ipomoea batatas]GMD57540.1 hypothetical protein Iba_chr11eCG13730 [Ipomoea batatas]
MNGRKKREPGNNLLQNKLAAGPIFVRESMPPELLCWKIDAAQILILLSELIRRSCYCPADQIAPPPNGVLARSQPPKLDRSVKVELTDWSWRTPLNKLYL